MFPHESVDLIHYSVGLRLEILGKVKILHSVQTCSETNTAFCVLDTGHSSPDGKVVLA
jgi:hypothetical protein